MTEGMPEIVPTVTIAIENMRELVDWVGAGETLEERQDRAEQAKTAVERALANVDGEKFNRTVREQARRITHGDPR